MCVWRAEGGERWSGGGVGGASKHFYLLNIFAITDVTLVNPFKFTGALRMVIVNLIRASMLA